MEQTYGTNCTRIRIRIWQIVYPNTWIQYSVEKSTRLTPSECFKDCHRDASKYIENKSRVFVSTAGGVYGT